MVDKFSSIEERYPVKDILIFYNDDDNTLNQSGVTLLNIGPGHVEFLDKYENLIIIPLHRVLKMKLKKGDADF